MRARGVLAFAGAVTVAAAVLAGCSTTSTEPSPTNSATVDPSACLIGAWSVDMRLFASNAGAAVPGLTRRAASGSINIGVTPETFTTTFDAMLSGSQPAQGDKQSAQYDVQLAGGSTASYSANAATLAMSDPSGAINVTAKVTVDGKSTAVDDVTIFEPLGAFTSGTVAYTCTGDSMTVTNQAGVSLNATRTA